MVTGIMFPPQSLFDVILEAVFPACGMSLVRDIHLYENAARLSALKSGNAHRNLMDGIFLAGSSAEGLTMTSYWGHPEPDMDLMFLCGAQLGVTIPGAQAPSNQHGLASTSSLPSTSSQSLPDNVPNSCPQHAPGGCRQRSQWLRVTDTEKKTGWGQTWPDMDSLALFQAELGVTIPVQQTPDSQHEAAAGMSSSPSASPQSLPCNCHNSWLEYAPEGCSPAFTRLRVTNIQNFLWHPWVEADCVEEEDGQYWLNTHHLNKRLLSALNKLEIDPNFYSSSISGPAGQVVTLGINLNNCNQSMNGVRVLDID